MMAKKKTSKYYKRKADKLISELFVGQPCVVCKLMGRINTKDTCGHHLIPRRNVFSRHSLWNIIPLCPTHHLFSNEIAAHSSNYFAQNKFEKLIKQHYPKHYRYWKLYQHKIGHKMDYEKICEELPDFTCTPPCGEAIMYELPQ